MKQTKLLYTLLTVTFLSITSTVTAGQFNDYEFNQERMVVAYDTIYIISSFENEDHLSAYSDYGNLLWNAPFHAKIISWQMKGGRIFVFSKSRMGYKTFLTCLDAYTGELIWQRP